MNYKYKLNKEFLVIFLHISYKMDVKGGRNKEVFNPLKL